MFRLKQDVRSVATETKVSFPMMDHGSIFEGVLGPPASKPVKSTVKGVHKEKERHKQNRLYKYKLFLVDKSQKSSV